DCTSRGQASPGPSRVSDCHIAQRGYGGAVVKRTWFSTLALSLSVGIGAAFAQQRPISGKVTSAASGEPVAGATVSVVGTPVAAVTNERGEFTLTAPLGAATLLIRHIGFTHQQIAVPPEQTRVEGPV